MPIDIAKEQLLSSTLGLARTFPPVPMLPMCANYIRLKGLPHLEHGEASQRLVFFQAPL
jgi:uncharacterized SAM-dependent methyltransferase